jgi:low temperature requirement protein LtrA
MMENTNRNIWWGPPRKFTAVIAERKISWLELFYDLVYAIIVSRVTRLLSTHVSWTGLVDYIFLFVMVFWGWFNGSMHHDMHGSPGIRTRFMTLWQMVIAAALAVALDSPADKLLFRTTITLAVLQFYVIYLWWSVGIYDKDHRKLNRLYTIYYLLALVLTVSTLYIPDGYKRVVFLATIVLNYLPFFTMSRTNGQRLSFELSPSMLERLGLFTIIVFGESILGVVNGMDILGQMKPGAWVCFGIGIIIVFALWWIFFSLIADRESRKGFAYGRLIPAAYIPTVASLGSIGANFPCLLKTLNQPVTHDLYVSALLYGSGLCVFLWCVVMLSMLLVYPENVEHYKRRFQWFIFLSGVAIMAITFAIRHMELWQYLTAVFAILMLIIVLMTRSWYHSELVRISAEEEATTS